MASSNGDVHSNAEAARGITDGIIAPARDYAVGVCQ